MDHFVVYILFSPKFGRTYVGFTSDLISRMKSHNELSSKGFTKNFRPWEVIHLEFFENKQDAMKREKFYKSGGGRQRIFELLNGLEGSYPPKA